MTAVSRFRSVLAMRTAFHLVLGLSLLSLGACAEQPGKKKEETKAEDKTEKTDSKPDGTKTETKTETKVETKVETPATPPPAT